MWAMWMMPNVDGKRWTKHKAEMVWRPDDVRPRGMLLHISFLLSPTGRYTDIKALGPE
jgi:hypothetical protein